MSGTLDELLKREIALDRARSDRRESCAVGRLSNCVGRWCRADALMPVNARG